MAKYTMLTRTLNNMTPQEQPDSQAGDALDTILQVLCDTVFQHGQALRTSNPFHHGEPMKDARALIEAYAERLATERAIKELKALQPSIRVNGQYVVDGNDVDDRIATLTAEADK